MPGAFQRSAFQNNAFQVDGAGGGARRKLIEQIEAEAAPADRRKRPIRPIWDKGPVVVAPPVETAPQAQPIIEARAPERSLPEGPADLSNLTRILIPPTEVGPQSQPERKRAKLRVVEPAVVLPAEAFAAVGLAEAADEAAATGRVDVQAFATATESDSAQGFAQAAIVASSTLAEQAETGIALAQNLICARGQAKEDPDVLIANAVWDDDELALAVLMLADDDE